VKPSNPHNGARYTQREIAQAAGKSRQTIDAIERSAMRKIRNAVMNDPELRDAVAALLGKKEIA
jgi:DNA-binding XRE family transcriptional regulator